VSICKQKALDDIRVVHILAVEHGCCITEMTELTDRRPANSQALSTSSCAACESANATGAPEADLLRADLHRENACAAAGCAYGRVNGTNQHLTACQKLNS
jgi:hypothetical protein